MMKNFISYILVGMVVFSTTAFMSYQSNNKTLRSPENDSYHEGENHVFIDEPMINFFVQANYKRGTTLKAIQNADKLDQIIPDYPSTWITNYKSVKISLTDNETTVSANSSDNTLSADQKSLLASAKIYSELSIKVTYDMVNAVTQELQERYMDLSLSVIPESEAAFPGGLDALDTYLKTNLEGQIPADYKMTTACTISFTIDENGQPIRINVLEPSNKSEIDDLFVKALEKMPKWLPARTSNAHAIEQEFRLYFGLNGC